MVNVNRGWKAFLMGLVGMTLSASSALGCQTAMIPNSRAKLMGKNYVWHLGHGRVYLNRKNMKKEALLKDETSNKSKIWVSAYPSMTFNQFAENFPNGGMNSEGLGIEVLLGPAEFPKVAARGKEAISELQWIQFILDTSATTAEAIRNAETVDIIPMSGHQVHYHACDRSGECAVFEYRDGTLLVSRRDGSNENPVACTNSGYATRSYRPAAGEVNPKINPEELGVAVASLPRAVYPAAGVNTNIGRMIDAFGEKDYRTASDEVTAMFKMLNSISASPQWQIVYELENKRVHFRAQVDAGGRRIKSIGLEDFGEAWDLDCRNAKFYDEKARAAYILPPMRHDLATSGGADVLKRADFNMRNESHTLLAQSASFLKQAGLDSRMLEKVHEYPAKRTVCLLE